MRRPLLVLGAGLLLVVVAAVVLASGRDPSDAERTATARAEQARRLALDAGLPDAVADFLARAAGATARTFTVTYVLPGEEGAITTVHQDPPRRRVDVRSTQNGVEVTRAQFVSGDAAHACVRLAAEWSCERVDETPAVPGVFDEATVRRTVQSLRSSRAAYRFRVAERSLAGARATCLVTEPRAAAAPSPVAASRGTLCISPEGATLLIESRTTSLRAERYSTDVDDAAFDLPARPS